MISYEPLYKTLTKKKMNLKDLQALLSEKDSSVRQYLMQGKYISLSTLDKICIVLNCKIQDVIEWKEGEQVITKPKLYAKVNFGIFINEIKQSGITLEEAALTAGHTRSYLYQLSRKDKLKKRDIIRLCKEFKLDYDNLISKGFIID